MAQCEITKRKRVNWPPQKNSSEHLLDSGILRTTTQLNVCPHFIKVSLVAHLKAASPRETTSTENNQSHPAPVWSRCVCPPCTSPGSQACQSGKTPFTNACEPCGPSPLPQRRLGALFLWDIEPSVGWKSIVFGHGVEKAAARQGQA